MGGLAGWGSGGWGSIRAGVCVGEPEEVPLTAPPGPLREDRERQHLGVGEQVRAPRFRCQGCTFSLLPLVDNDVQVNQLWFEVHAPPPFLWEIGAAVARVFLGPTEREAVATLTWAYSGSRNRTTAARRVRPSGLPARRASPSRCGDRTARTGIAWPWGWPASLRSRAAGDRATPRRGAPRLWRCSSSARPLYVPVRGSSR